MGPSSRFGDPIVASARPLLRNIVETAREVIDGERNLAASLRFGHDVYLIPLASLLQASVSAARISDADSIRSCWSIEKVSPMAANIQFIFFRHERTAMSAFGCSATSVMRYCRSTAAPTIRGETFGAIAKGFVRNKRFCPNNSGGGIFENASAVFFCSFPNGSFTAGRSCGR